MINIADKAYTDLLRDVLENGTDRSDRTGTGTIGIFGAQLKFDVSERIPLLTTKKVNINNIIHETIWMFVHGSTNTKYLTDNGVNIWNDWCQADFSYPPINRLKGWVKVKPFKEFEEYKGDFSTKGLNAAKNSLEDSLRNLWVKMMKRCYDESSHNYKFYGAKGIFVDKSWHDVQTFVTDVQNLPNWKSKKTSWNLYELDKDYYGSNYYSKETCTWLHTSENNLYIDKPLQITDDSGKSSVYLSYQEASDSLNIPKTNLHRWVIEGLSEKCNLEYRKYLNYSFSIAEKEGFVYRYLFTSGYLGPIYGTQARRYQSWKYQTEVDEENGTGYAIPVFEEVDQIRNIISSIKTDPYSRRHVMTLWNPSTVPDARLTFEENILQGNSALPVCHGALIQFYVEKDQDLSLQVYIRSNDLFLGNPYNLINYTLLLYMVAQVTGYKPKNLVVTIGDAHIYKNHIQQVKEQLSRPIDKESPVLKLNPDVKAFDDFKFEDFTLEGYDPYPFIKAPISV